MSNQKKEFSQTLFQNLQPNYYDNAIDKIIKEREKELNDLNSKLDNYLGLEKIICAHEIYIVEDEILAISEMKILYAYKHFEIYLKHLLNILYQDDDARKLFKWKDIKYILKTKGIKISEINNYHEINQLRELNNSIKHSKEIINNKTKDIKELKTSHNMSYLSLLAFYDRIKYSPYQFITSLSEKTGTELY